MVLTKAVLGEAGKALERARKPRAAKYVIFIFSGSATNLEQLYVIDVVSEMLVNKLKRDGSYITDPNGRK